MARRRVTAVITDLDNTLWDWVEIWYSGFRELLQGVAEATQISVETLEREFKQIHERHATSEYAFSLQELPSLIERYPGDSLPKRFDEVIHRCNKARKDATKLYPTVGPTLRALKEKGCVVVGYTESMAFYTLRRVKELGLDGLLDYVYSPEDHALPASREEIRKLPPDAYRLFSTVHRHTPPGELKPNPKILLQIIEETGLVVDEAVYVGDTLVKDVVMAQSAHVIDVWAKYGVATGRADAYGLLRRVTHWPAEMVERERAARPENVRPSFVLEHQLSELLDLFEFGYPPRLSGDPNLGHAMDAWKTAVQVQQHFNDLELRIRNFAITILLAALAAAGFAMKEHLEIPTISAPATVPALLAALGFLAAAGIAKRKALRWMLILLAASTAGASWHFLRGETFEISPSIPALLMIAGLVGWSCCYFMDRFWYHRLLKGAVSRGLFIERRLRFVLPEIALARSIGEASPLAIGAPHSTPLFEIRSDRKIDILYTVVMALLCLGIYVFWSVPPVPPQATTTTTSPPAAAASAQATAPQAPVTPAAPTTATK